MELKYIFFVILTPETTHSNSSRIINTTTYKFCTFKIFTFIRNSTKYLIKQKIEIIDSTQTFK